MNLRSCCGALLVAVAIAVSFSANAADLPQIQFDTSHIGPRPIEDVTSHNIPRDYGRAWATLEGALEQNNAGVLDSYFTGTALDKLKERVTAQQKSGLHTRYIDHGHKVEATFYSPDGGAIQLDDTANLQIQILDGQTVVHDENITLHYVALMTPAADRWDVRLLESVP